MGKAQGFLRLGTSLTGLFLRVVLHWHFILGAKTFLGCFSMDGVSNFQQQCFGSKMTNDSHVFPKKSRVLRRSSAEVHSPHSRYREAEKLFEELGARGPCGQLSHKAWHFSEGDPQEGTTVTCGALFFPPCLGMVHGEIPVKKRVDIT